jgi:hypothetical protein
MFKAKASKLSIDLKRARKNIMMEITKLLYNYEEQQVQIQYTVIDVVMHRYRS